MDLALPQERSAGFWIRSTAFMVDLLSSLYMGQALSTGILAALAINFEESFYLYLVFSLVLCLAILLLQDLAFGISLGKLVLGIQTRSANGAKPGKTQLLVKGLLKMIWFIDAFAVVSSERKLSLANRITKTKTTWTKRRPLFRAIFILGWLGCILVVFQLTLWVSAIGYSHTDIVKSAQAELDKAILEHNDASQGYLKKERALWFNTLRRGGTLQENDYQLLAEWAASTASRCHPGIGAG